MGMIFNGTSAGEQFTLEDGDVANGNGGDDRFRAFRSYIAGVTIHAGPGNDYVDVFNWQDMVAYGEAGDDELGGGYVTSYLDGGDGNDLFHLEKGTYTIVGGAGNDTILVALPSQPPVIHVPEYDPRNLAVLESSSVRGDAGKDVVSIQADPTARVTVAAGNGFNTITVTHLTDKTVSIKAYDIELVLLNGTEVWQLDVAAPVLTAISPNSGASAVAASTNITLTFSEPVQRGAGSIVLKTSSGTTVATYDAALSTNLSFAGNVLTINPSTDLSYGTTYSVSFPIGSIKDVAGNAWAGGITYTFSTDIGPTVSGTPGEDRLMGGVTNDRLLGGAGNDVLTGGPGNDVVDGGADVDIASYAGPRASYRIGPLDVARTVTSLAGTDGVDTLLGVERLRFADRSTALDLDGNAGTVAKLIGAVFGAAAVTNPVFVGIGLHYLDTGMTVEALAQLAIEATGKSSPAEVVALLWANVVGGTVPDDQRLIYVGMLESGTSVGSLVTLAANTEANAASIGLTGLASAGLDFIPFVGS